MTFVLTGLDIEAKAELVRSQLEAGLTVSPPNWSGRWPAPTIPTPTPRRPPARCCTAWCATRIPPTSDANSLRPQSNSRQLSRIHHHRTPGEGQVYGVFTRLRRRRRGAARRRARRRQPVDIAPATTPANWRPFRPALPEPLPFGTRGAHRWADRRRAQRRQGRQRQRRVWVRTDEQWRWLAHTLTVEKLRECCPRQPICRSPVTCCPTCGR